AHKQQARLPRSVQAQNDMMLAGKAAARICNMLDTAVLYEMQEPLELPLRPEVTFEAIGFSYNEQSSALNDVSFSLAPGSITALVGPSGSGKSTLAKLLPRFWDVSDGAIRIAGYNIKEIPLKQLYQTVSFVFQDTELLRMSIASNISLARPDASQLEIEAAAIAAQVHDKIAALPKGYNTVVGEDTNLSGGEAQRIAIARAILADAPILVLDEATAFVDPEAEAEIQQALAELVAGRTLLVIAHRLTTISEADHILVMDKGNIVERGTHKTLLMQQGLYQKMWQSTQLDEITK
ncbi:MAG: ATP-binding cassette domain-containing protein, partial [Pseudomonadota bacterium]